MLSREERIFSELLLARGLVARELIEGYARKKRSGGDSEPSLAEILIDSGGLGRAQAEEALEEARAIDGALAPNLTGGARLGEFLLLREIGRGGMGIVYEAQQESLGRRVALKVLPAGAALDERLAIRFLREARAAARLQHPGIVPVFASGRAEGVLFFAMELVDGRSLAEIVADDGPLAPERAARVTAEVARALHHAHEADLVHRDVKPENILLASDGRARLTDFGLVHESVTRSFTLPRHVLGTPAYMAPEQALGHAVDRRSDIYALGAVLYTLLCGKPPYAGEVPSIVLSRVLSAPPAPLDSARAGIPPSLTAICERAMARKPEDRYDTAAELAADLEAFGRGETPAIVPPRRSGTVAWLVGTLTLVGAGALLAAFSMRGASNAPPSAVAQPDPTFVLASASAGVKQSPSFSSNGELLAYVSRSSRDSAAKVENLVTHEIVTLPDPIHSVAVSPDGRSVAFGADGRLSSFDLASGAIRHFAEFGRAGQEIELTWSPDSREIVAVGPGDLTQGGSRRIWAIDAATGRVRVVRSMDARAPAYSPHGLRIAFVSRTGGAADVWTVPPRGGDAVRLTEDLATDWSPFWSPDGKRIYFGSERNGTPRLWSVEVDEASGLPVGSAEPALQLPFPGMFFATLSGDGKRMAIMSHGDEGRLFRLPFDPGSATLTGAPVALPRHPGAGTAPQPSPDGRFIVYSALTPEQDLAIVAADGSGEPRFVTNDEFADRAPRWSPDGSHVAFHSNRSGRMEIWTVRPDGSDLRQVTQTTDGNAVDPVWSPDGTRIAYSVEGAGAHVIATASGPSLPEALPPLGAGETFQVWSWSPDGTTLAGSSAGVVLYSLRERRYRRITDVGGNPVWLPDGRRLLFASERSLFVVDSDGGSPREIFRAAPSGLPPFIGLSPDGRSIYASLTAAPEEIWIADLPD